MKDHCHALEIFFKLNEDINHFKITNLFECKNLHVVLISGKVAPDYWAIKKKHDSKFSKWTIKCVEPQLFDATLKS